MNRLPMIFGVFQRTLPDFLNIRLLRPRAGLRGRKLLVISEVYRQQNEMYYAKKRKIPHRIVSISQPHVRPIKRGKAAANWEFGPKISIGMTDGYTTIHRIGWDNFNESGDLTAQADDYRRVHGVYPESIHADKIYRNRANLKFCRENGIRLSGPPLGRPPKDEAVRRALHRQWREDEQVRNAVEGKFGEAKRAYSLGRLKTKLKGTSETVISMVFLVMNMRNLLRKEASSCSSNVLCWLLAQLREIPEMIQPPVQLCCSVEC
ncbi:MAG: transposase [Candidatus Aegiribacteria sp.]|nr:transposase [Candidatus Aegiribacteria sp.]